ncbi:hypothetical protein L1D44_09855 [Shewanella sp. Isolate13]|uniref:hypothetical protein n=1 Tax=Shewanella sp. Isolate13 TaxID=2908531 RepID=UPI001EFDE314|nr:hypothetical protein [Shewanella sp. Isolate13]MCG9730155.1 hypothetical protein [Shewanella sp. Isolate13]
MTKQKNKLKNKLKDELIADDFQVEERSGKLKVKLGGLAAPVYIENDFAKNLFIVNTREAVNAIFLGSLLFLTLTNAPSWQQALLLSMIAIGFLNLLLTEIKSQPLRQRVNLFNRMNCA